MGGPVVHVDEVRGLVAIEWPDRPGVTVGDSERGVRSWDRSTVPPFMTRYEAPKETTR